MTLTNAKLSILALTALGMLALTALLYILPGHSTRTAQSGELLVQGLDPAVLGKITLKQGEQTTTLVPDDKGRYRIEEKHNYPASLQELNTLLLSILDTRIARQPEVADPTECGFAPNKSSQGSLTLFGKDGKELLALRIGNSTDKGTFIAKGDSIYLSEKIFDFRAAPKDFLNDRLYALAEKDLLRIEVVSAGAKYAFMRGKDNSLQLAEVPAGKEENTSESWGVKSGLERVSIEDVRPAAGAEFKPEFTAEVTLENSLKYTLAIAKSKDGKYLAQVSAVPPSQKEIQASMQLSTSTGKAELAKKDAILSAVDTAKAFNELHSGWLYQLPDWSAQRLLTPFDKLLKDAPKPAAPATDGGKSATTPGIAPAASTPAAAEAATTAAQ